MCWCVCGVWYRYSTHATLSINLTYMLHVYTYILHTYLYIMYVYMYEVYKCTSNGKFKITCTTNRNCTFRSNSYIPVYTNTNTKLPLPSPRQYSSWHLAVMNVFERIQPCSWIVVKHAPTPPTPPPQPPTPLKQSKCSSGRLNVLKEFSPCSWIFLKHTQDTAGRS